MGNCSKCKEKAIFLNPNFCKKHFIDYFENKVKKTIKDYGLFSKKDKIAVACSGGKDSTTILFILKKSGFNVEALAINEGIDSYRNHTLVDLKKFCKENKVKLKVVSFKEEFGNTLDEMLKQRKNPCTVCGIFRRNLMNRYSKDYDKIVTGHNLDDEAQAVMMNLFTANVDLLDKSNPKSKKIKGFTQRIKPLYFCSEKEVAAYALLKGFEVGFTECPYVHKAFRHDVRSALNNFEEEHKGTKLNILKKHLKNISKIKTSSESIAYCSECGEPSRGKICKACKLLSEIQSFK